MKKLVNTTFLLYNKGQNFDRSTEYESFQNCRANTHNMSQRKGTVCRKISMKSHFQREVIPDKLLNPFKSVSSSDRTMRMKSSNEEAVRNVLGREGNTFISSISFCSSISRKKELINSLDRHLHWEA